MFLYNGVSRFAPVIRCAYIKQNAMQQTKWPLNRRPQPNHHLLKNHKNTKHNIYQTIILGPTNIKNGMSLDCVFIIIQFTSRSFTKGKNQDVSLTKTKK